jgi:hypothetical protein
MLHFITEITDEGLAWRRDQNKIAGEAALDGIYVIRTSLPAGALGADDAVEFCKALENVERAFRGLNSDLLIRPTATVSETASRPRADQAARLPHHLAHATAARAHPVQGRRPRRRQDGPTEPGRSPSSRN